ncbi:hypothetical protein FLONG3_6025 [Fusarium longipes]|uniref:FAD-binding domain-containing protein n=1 Tax=Fusarium longipes TaxID=694270 RepID=A0A395SQ42_9HYPO|nr:hypothetical protein FLONG3_6025 [Fusarium longipes]
MDKSKPRVIIAGGGISGLALANMLEKAHIEFVLLESYDKIAPQVGASIGLQPNGLRILDQLGCADELLSLIDFPLNNAFARNSDGSILRNHKNSHKMLKEKHGYPTIFIDRQSLMQTLYDNLESKDSVHESQAVKSVAEVDNGIQVTTDKGEIFEGDILVGADGIYSTVRKEMWRLGNKSSPGYFPTDEWSSVPCYYKCIFGMSQPMDKLTKGTHYVYNDNFSYLVMVGPGGKFYWFLFVKLPVPLYGRKIPRYTKEDEEKLAREHASDQITPEVTFSQLYEARTTSTLTPLHEYVFHKWHYNRIITIGDAAHKFEPLTGHGGNAAIETAASLINHLLSVCKNWTPSEIDAAFAAVQKERHDRVQWLVDDAHKVQQMHAKATPLFAIIAPILARLINTDTAIRLSSHKLVDATRINCLPVPHRAHTVPFNDELSARPWASTWLPIGLGVLSQGALFRLAYQILLPLPYPTRFGGETLVTHYTGVKTVDAILKRLGSIFGIILQPENPAGRLQWIAFMPLLLSTTFDWTLESYRLGLKGLPTSFPFIFGTLFQLRGIGKIAPLYHMISVCEQILGGSISTVAGRSIDADVVPSTIAGLALGYIIPSTLMTWPFRNKATWQKFVALWQPFPLYVASITAGVSVISRTLGVGSSFSSNSTVPEKSGKFVEQKQPSHSLLRYVYISGAAAATIVHFWSLYRIASGPDLSVSKVFGTIGDLISGQSSSDPNTQIANFFQRDMFLNAASVLVNSLYRTLDLRRSGYITNKEALTASLTVLIAQPIVGPAASHIGFLGWREEMFNRVQKKIGSGV